MVVRLLKLQSMLWYLLPECTHAIEGMNEATPYILTMVCAYLLRQKGSLWYWSHTSWPFQGGVTNGNEPAPSPIRFDEVDPDEFTDVNDDDLDDDNQDPDDGNGNHI